MNNKNKKLPDTQNKTDKRKIPINRVGIKNLRYPILVKDRDNKHQHTIAMISMTVDLPMHFKGTHMSRFVEILEKNGKEINIESLFDILTEMQNKLHAKASHIVLEFPYFRTKTAPVSKLQSLMDYRVKFHAVKYNGDKDFIMTVVVPVKTLCPCSKNISKYGAHNQRGDITVSVRFKGNIWIEEIIDAVEGSASCDLYALLKREDEKYVTEKAYKNPVFVEDVSRNTVMRLKKMKNIKWYSVEAENYESIHNHNAYAHIESTNICKKYKEFIISRY